MGLRVFLSCASKCISSYSYTSHILIFYYFRKLAYKTTLVSPLGDCLYTGIMEHDVKNTRGYIRVGG